MLADGWGAQSTPKRDRLIGCGACAYALVWASHISVHLLMFPWGGILTGVLRWITFVAMLLGGVAGIVGLGLVGLALARGGKRRDARVQRGAVVAAGAYFPTRGRVGGFDAVVGLVCEVG